MRNKKDDDQDLKSTGKSIRPGRTKDTSANLRSITEPRYRVLGLLEEMRWRKSFQQK